MASLIKAYGPKGVLSRCDARCYGASAGGCHCICGGRNHGRGLLKAQKATKRMFACKTPLSRLKKRMNYMGVTQVVGNDSLF